MPTITEIAPDIFRISTYVPEADLQFAQFLVRDEAPLLFHSGPRALFPLVRDAVATLIEPRRLRWVAFSHFEADECGSLNDWLALAPEAVAACSIVGAVTSVDDTASRPARPLADGAIVTTGRHRLRFLQTPHVPHCWDAGLLFDETTRTLLCSDLLTHTGDVAPTAGPEILDRHRDSLLAFEAGPLAGYLPYTRNTVRVLERLAALAPAALATMHGSTLLGDGAAALRALEEILRDVLGTERP
jgi:flavorubredoxin